MRENGRFDEAAAIDREIQVLFRDRDPDLLRANELKQRATEARLDGNHQDAGLYERQANELLERIRQLSPTQTGVATTSA